MIQLIYISTAVRDVTELAVNEIPKKSRLNNATSGVTGLLLYDGRRFLQALEGNEARIDETYRRIKADPRHRAIVLLSSKTIEQKAFGSWAMAAQAATQQSSEADLVQQVDTLTADLTDLTLQAHFRSFARVRAAA